MATEIPRSTIIKITTIEMGWEQGRQLSHMSVDEGQYRFQTFYSYDADGIRTEKSVDLVDHSYVTQNGKVVRETISDGTTTQVLDFVYEESGRPFALIYTNGTAEPVTYYYVLNLQGDVVGLINASGTFVAKYTYTAWGEILTATGDMASINPLRYRGYYYDAETGFYYLQSRYYDPVSHRFINADGYASTGQGFIGTNMFAYCRNNPTIRIDESGSYDRDAAIDYAEEWADDANVAEYQSFVGKGGDCANFISQCLEAGGIEENKGWYCKRYKAWNFALWIYNLINTGTIYFWEYSNSWKFADSQFNYFSNPHNGYINGSPIAINQNSDLKRILANYDIQKGDLMYFRNSKGVSHATIISSVDGSMIYYAAHSTSQFNKPLSELDTFSVYVVRIRDDA